MCTQTIKPPVDSEGRDRSGLHSSYRPNLAAVYSVQTVFLLFTQRLSDRHAAAAVKPFDVFRISAANDGDDARPYMS